MAILPHPPNPPLHEMEYEVLAPPRGKPVQADELLIKAAETLKQRAAQRDVEQERSMARTVAIFNAWTGLNLTENDGWRFMVALKQAREIQGTVNEDDYVDGAAYFALLGEKRIQD